VNHNNSDLYHRRHTDTMTHFQSDSQTQSQRRLCSVNNRCNRNYPLHSITTLCG